MNLADKIVLIVDDFQNMRSTLRQMLLPLGFRNVDVAATGEEALGALRTRHYDVIVCDYNLGRGLDGQQLLELGREEGMIDLGTVFVMVTGENSSAMVLGALESGPDAYVSKPFTKELLHARLDRALRRRAPLAPVAQALAREGAAAALAALQPLLAHDDGNRLEWLRVQTDLALRQGALDVAERACQEALRASPPPAWALTALGRVAQAREHRDEAEALYRRAIATTAHFMEAQDRLAELYEACGRDIEALQVLRAAVARSPKSLRRQRRLARLAFALEQFDLSVTAWREVLAIGQRMGVAQAADRYGEILALLAAGDGLLAKKRLGEFARRDRRDPDAPWWLLAARLRCLGGGAEARAALLTELELQLRQSAPPPAAATALAATLAACGERTRAARLEPSFIPAPAGAGGAPETVP